jgi:protein ImuA
MNANLQQLLHNGRLWRGGQHRFRRPADDGRGLASGHAALDRALPFGGWPRGALTEILHPYPGQGELQLLLPALARLSRDKRYVVLIDPPWQPYAPALHTAGMQLAYCISLDGLAEPDRHWALEQALRADHCGAALAWPRRNPDNKALRRLQLAAESGGGCAFLFRSPRVRDQHSPAALRLQLHPGEHGAELEILKCRGRHADSTRIQVPLFNNPA